MCPESVAENQSSLSGVERILGGAVIPPTREELGNLVETPLLPACQKLYDKNIRTVISSANIRDAQIGYAYITLDFSTMSDENRAIAQSLGVETSDIPLPSGDALIVGGLKLPITPEMTVEELSEAALQAANKFKEQPMLWAPRYSLSQIMLDNPNLSGEAILEDLIQSGYFFDPDEQKFYLSREHFCKVTGLSI